LQAFTVYHFPFTDPQGATMTVISLLDVRRVRLTPEMDREPKPAIG